MFLSRKITLKAIVNYIANMFNITDEHRQKIYDDIVFGSDPNINYYLLLLLSALIAAFGLAANSVAVVIGAMLVSPLMMPIFGISLSMITGETSLLRSSMLSEFGGILLVIGAGYIVGLSPLSPDMTMEIISRTSPNIVDLFVAALAGFAGCMALIDKRISPILPGIAMATSLSPPLAACGLCLAFGAYQGAMGALILFLANFLTILFVGSATFIASGFFTGSLNDHKVVFAKRFSLAAVSMIILVFFLTNAMLKLIENKRITSKVKDTVREELYDKVHYSLRDISIDRRTNSKEINAMVVIDAPKEPSPLLIEKIEEKLKKNLKKDINVFVQTRITKSVSSSKDKLIRFYRNADGIEEEHRTGRDMQILNIAGQAIRERLQQIPGLRVHDVELLQSHDGRKIVYTTVHGSVRPYPEGVKILEDKIRKDLNDQNIYLIAHYIESYDIGSDGINHNNIEEGTVLDKNNTTFVRKLQEYAKNEIRKQTHLSPYTVKTTKINGRWVVTTEVGGSRVMTRQEASNIQTMLRQKFKQNILFFAYSKAEAMIGGEHPDKNMAIKAK